MKAHFYTDKADSYRETILLVILDFPTNRMRNAIVIPETTSPAELTASLRKLADWTERHAKE